MWLNWGKEVLVLFLSSYWSFLKISFFFSFLWQGLLHHFHDLLSLSTAMAAWEMHLLLQLSFKEVSIYVYYVWSSVFKKKEEKREKKSRS